MSLDLSFILRLINIEEPSENVHLGQLTFVFTEISPLPPALSLCKTGLAYFVMSKDRMCLCVDSSDLKAQAASQETASLSKPYHKNESYEDG